MALEYLGVDSVSGQKRYFDTAKNEYVLGEMATAQETSEKVFGDSQMEAVKTAYRESNDQTDSSTTNATGSGRLDSQNDYSAAETTSDPAPNNKLDIAKSKTADKTTSDQAETNPEKSSSSSLPGAPFKSKEKYLQAVENNILHNYRSFTYNFAIGAITPEAVSNHKYLERDILAYPVLNSAGKGTKGVGISSQGLNGSTSNFEYTKNLVDGFNKSSSGRFDMYIDNVVIESLLGAGSKQGGASMASNITFDVYEPYSMNGFIEALQVAGKAAGYSDYIKSCFVLRVQFQGYPDTATNAQMRPEVVPMSTRYFPFTITKVDVDVNEQGTRYRVDSVPINQLGLGSTTNSLLSDIKVEGKTVGEVLENFFKELNRMSEDQSKQANAKVIDWDKYEISAPKLVTPGTSQNTKAAVLNGSTSTSFTSKIIEAKMNDELTSLNVFKFADPNNYPGASTPGSTSTQAVSNPSTGKINVTKGTVMFSSGAQIHDCIAAIVRDSTYTRDLLKPEKILEYQKSDGLVTYFTVRLETDIRGEDGNNNKRFQTFRYVLEPYQVHYTRIPGQEQGTVDLTDIKGRIKRAYNYIYTGKNVDVLKFNLNFNNLYFSAIPAMLGNRPATNPKAGAAGATQIVETKNQASQAVSADQQNSSPSSTPTASRRVDPSTNNFVPNGAKAGQPQGDPYALMAQNLHETILNSVDLIGGTIDILGDPYFLVTGGMGNIDLTLKEPMLTKDGQAPVTQGDVYININFRNPIDINLQTGLADFGSHPISFSGVYRVNTLKNSFRDGVFTQSLDILRVPGQILEPGKQATPALPVASTPRAGQQVVKDTASESILRSGIRPSDFNLANLLARGLPSTGLPGSISNFTNSLIDKASSAAGTVGGLLTQVQGATGAVGNLANQLGTSPISGVNALTSGVRLAASGLSQISQVPNTLAATVAAGGNAIQGIANIPGAAVKLAGNVVDSVTALPTTAVLAVSQITGNTSLSSIGTSFSGLTSNLTIAPQAVLDSATGAATSVMTNAAGTVNAVAGLPQAVAGFATQGAGAVSDIIGNAKNAIAGLQNTIPTDLNAVGAKLGIDTSALAGFSPALSSKMKDELVAVAKEIPINTDLSSLKEQGVSFASMVREKLPNLPAVQPKSVAPDAISDPGISEIAKKYGNIGPLLSGNISLPPTTDINKVLNPLGSLSAGLSSGVGSLTAGIQSTMGSAQAVMGAVGNANTIVNNAIGSAAGIANNVGSLAQNTIQGFSPASIGLGSVESNVLNVAGLTQNVTSQVNSLGVSLSAQYGSLQTSPLAKLVKDNNIQGIV